MPNHKDETSVCKFPSTMAFDTKNSTVPKCMLCNTRHERGSRKINIYGNFLNASTQLSIDPDVSHVVTSEETGT